MIDLSSLRFDDRGLVPVVVQDVGSGAVLMLAWADREAVERTAATGQAHFWSRSRQALWKKGETSGNTLAVVELRIDCDLDAVLVRAQPAGPTCHTGRASCFFHRDGAPAEGPEGEPEGEPEDVIDDGPALPILLRLAKIIEARR